ncbi:MAG: hypothetical protein ACO1NZ_11080 [Adhaeribacter sp.]
MHTLKLWCPLLLAAACLCLLPPAFAADPPGGYNRPLQTYQQKYLVPEHLADSLWRYLLRTYHTRALQKVDPRFTVQPLQETYVDEYFDDARQTLQRHQHSLRLRRIFAGKHVDRSWIQLKTSPRPRLRPGRQLIYFNLNDRPDKHAQNPGHPFLRLVRQADRRQLDSLLAALNVHPPDLRPVLSLYQQRRQLYLRHNGNDLALLSLDGVSSEDGQARFYELELTVEESRFARPDVRQRQRLSQVLEMVQLDLSRYFPALRQDPRPKYNKLQDLLHQGRPRPRLYNLAWLGIAGVLGGVLFFLWRSRREPEDKPQAFL